MEMQRNLQKAHNYMTTSQLLQSILSIAKEDRDSDIGNLNSESILCQIQHIYIQLYALCQSESSDTSCEFIIEQLQRLIDQYRNMPNIIMGGNCDLMWILGKLIKDDFIESPNFIWNLSYDIISRYSYYLNNSPYKIDTRQRFYPLGVCMMALHCEEDSIERFAWEEQIIFKLCDCEKYLTEASAQRFHVGKLNAGILHSIVAFADLAIQNHIYPNKALQVKQLAANTTYNSTLSTKSDIIILHLCLNHPIQDVLNKLSVDEIFQLLSEIGTLSVIYENCSLFKQAKMACEVLHPTLLYNPAEIPCQYLLGISMGLINLIRHHEI